ncbi:MAG: hypothetical protein IJK73_03725 [Bacteroidales bacterium]|nr:hypothetical protein [Bacteroidales bacterium]
MRISVHFSDFFNVSPEELEKYGAFNISLISDMPLFIDPFLLFSSNKSEYQALHKQILTYLSFLKERAEAKIEDGALIKSWYSFPEMKQNWLGYSQIGNSGKGLGRYFAKNMHSLMPVAFKDLGKESLTDSTHLEKVGLFNQGVGRDNISDFTTNLILDFLLKYTETFAKKSIAPELCSIFNVKKAYFDYQFQRWLPRSYYLPKYDGDFVVLTPKDILTRDETWINHTEMLDRFNEISEGIENEELRSHINAYFASKIPVIQMNNKEKNRYIKAAKWETLREFPELIEYYIQKKEIEKEEAKSVADEKVRSVESLLVTNVHHFIENQLIHTKFYDVEPVSSYVETIQRIKYLKDCIEKNDGYRLFYVNGKPISREDHLQYAFRFVWFASPFDVNREVNNGRGPADYKVSMGANDSTLVEFKLASNSSLKKNLQNQLEIYQAANNTQFGIKVIMYFTDEEKAKLDAVLRDLNLDNKKNVITIDARRKVSASKV